MKLGATKQSTLREAETALVLYEKLTAGIGSLGPLEQLALVRAFQRRAPWKDLPDGIRRLFIEIAR